jgi:hypothetical protein
MANRLGVPQQTISIHLAKMPELANRPKADLSKGFTVAQVAEKHGWTEHTSTGYETHIFMGVHGHSHNSCISLLFLCYTARRMIFQVFLQLPLIFFRHHAIYKGVIQKTI